MAKDAYDEGTRAFKAGITLDNNPYSSFFANRGELQNETPPELKAHFDWNEGWLAAENHQQIEDF